ncbi:MAG: ATP-binding protein [Chloroflexi bacterium]|nr:ATP-binding protein [Chloroflexota bacterium]
MNSFVNREAQLRLVDEAFRALLKKELLLRSPIIEFYGAGGIGKTTLLKKVEQKCNEERVPSIWADASQSDPNIFSHTIIEQAKKYRTGAMPGEGGGDPLHQSVDATRALLRQGPVVMLLDEVDTTDEERVRWIEAMLKDLVDESKLLVVMTSKSTVSFQQERSVARKLTSMPLQLLDRSSCEAYLDSIDNQIAPGLRDIIFEWTRGYPLAMQVMTEAVSAGRDPRSTQDQKDILDIIKDQVINRNVLARVDQEKRAQYYASLQLLSVPRRFNLVIMQELIEQFAPELSRESSLAYFALPREIQQATEVLRWNVPRAGYSVDAPIRNIFLLELKMEQPEDYRELHTFLAETNRRLATEVSGTDRLRYLREYLYHSAISAESQNISSLLQQVIKQITAERPEAFLQFYEEFIQDEELKEALGQHVTLAISLMHSHLARIYRQLATRTIGAQRLRYWREFFIHSIHDPEVTDLSYMLQETLTALTQEVSPEDVIKLFRDLARDEQFRASLGTKLDTFLLFLQENHLEG